MTNPTRSGFIASLRRALAAIDLAFCKLNRIQYDAPWKTGETRRC